MSEADPTELLRRLAERVADGEPIDWTLETAGLSERQRRRLSHLKAIEEISQSHRELFPPVPGPEPDTLPFERWGPLKLIEKTAEGGFGEVFRAEDERLGRMVALKLLPSDESRFVEEARKLAEISHPNVVTVHGVDHNQGRTGMWMEWLEGETLDERLRREGPQSAEEAALTGIDLCHALSAVHGAGLVHRDVKLTNLLRERGGRLVLMDFGSSSRRIGRGKDGRVSGTPAYLAPELLEGKDSGVRGDIYAAGVCLYRLASGEYPLTGIDVETIRAQHRERAYLPLSDANPHLPTAFIEVVERAMHPDPDKRYRSAGELEQALRRVIRPQATPAVARQKPRWPWVAAAAAAAVVVTVLVLGWPVLFPLEVEASFFRYDPVRNTEERLTTSSRLGLEDRVFMELKGNKELFVYVVSEDSRGNRHRLFPIEGLDRQNPLASDEVHELPGTIDGGGVTWEVNTSAREDTVLVVASRKRLAELEASIMKLPAPGETTTAVETEDLLPTLRGIGGLAPAPQRNAGTPDLDELKQTISFRDSGRRGVHVFEFKYRNPEAF